MFKRIDHIGVVVDSLDDAQGFLNNLGMRHVRDLVVPDRLRAAFYQCGDTQIEILEITNAEERGRRLGSEQARIEHIALEVENLDDTLAALDGLGVKFQGPPLVIGGNRSVWSLEETCDGVQYQVMQKGVAAPDAS